MRATLSLTLVIAAVAAHAVAPDGRPVLNSFVDRHVDTAQQLVDQVKNDQVVADRYERHFAMTRDEVVALISGLHRERLAQAGTFTIYSVPQDGHVKMHVGRIRKGEPMFFDRKGHPVLVVKCGNPVTLGPHVRGGNLSNPLIGQEAAMRELPANLGLLATEPSVLTALSPAVPDVPVEAFATLPAPNSPETFAETVTATAALSNGGSAFNTLTLLLPVLGSVAPIVAEMPIGSKPPSHGAGTVPEPASLVALGLGAVSTLARRRRAK